MSTKRDYDGWCIKHPNGRVLMWTFAETRRKCLDEYRAYYHWLRLRWRRLRRNGYKCVPVKLMEVQR